MKASLFVRSAGRDRVARDTLYRLPRLQHRQALVQPSASRVGSFSAQDMHCIRYHLIKYLSRGNYSAKNNHTTACRISH